MKCFVEVSFYYFFSDFDVRVVIPESLWSEEVGEEGCFSYLGGDFDCVFFVDVAECDFEMIGVQISYFYFSFVPAEIF